MNGATHANSTIPQPSKGVKLHKTKYGLNDIADLCLQSLKDDRGQMAQFAAAFTPDLNGLKSLFDFVDGNFNYREDPAVKGGQIQAVQSPMWLWWKTKGGDCKSFTNFIASTLYNMGVPVILRLVDYGNPTEKHIYPVAVLPGGREIPLDVVYKKQKNGAFGTQKRWKHKIKDIKVNPISNYVSKPGLYKVGASNSPNQPSYDEIWNGIEQLEAIMSDVPDDIVEQDGVDVTTLTQGELDRYLAADRFKVFAVQASDGKTAAMYRKAAEAVSSGSIAGLGTVASTEFGKRLQSFIRKTNEDTSPAFESFNIAIPKPADPDVEIVVGGHRRIRIGRFIKKITKKLAKLFKKLVNWIFKGAGKKAGPFFLFTFLGQSQINKSPEIRRRVNEQKKAFSWIAKKGKFSESKFRTLAATGIKENLGGTPEEVIAFYAKKQPGVGVIADAAMAVSKVIKAIKTVISIIKKITSLFKKKEATPRIDESTASDVNLLKGLDYADGGSGGSGGGKLSKYGQKAFEQARKEAAGEQGGGGSGGNGGGGNMLPIAAAAAALLIAFTG